VLGGRQRQPEEGGASVVIPEEGGDVELNAQDERLAAFERATAATRARSRRFGRI
jgi:hypothetical protein